MSDQLPLPTEPAIPMPLNELPTLLVRRELGGAAGIISMRLIDAESAKAIKAHVLLTLIHTPRERPSTTGLSEEEIEAMEDAIPQHEVHYLMSWLYDAGPLFNLRTYREPRPHPRRASIFPYWYEETIAKLASYVNGYLLTSTWRLSAMETRVPPALGDLIVNEPVEETPMELAYQRYERMQRVLKGEVAHQNTFFGEPSQVLTTTSSLAQELG